MPHTLNNTNLKDNIKDFRRNIRYLFLLFVTKAILMQSVNAVPKLRRLLIKIFPFFFRREIHKARDFLSPEFHDNKEKIIRGMLVNQVMNILEVFFYEKILAANPKFVTVEGREHLEKALKKNKGAIIFSGHFGNWELMGYALAAMGYPMHVIARPQAISRMTAFMNQFREGRNVKILMESNLNASLKVLKNKGVIGIVTDLNARERGYRVPFFGKEASFYPTPVILSVRSKAPLIPAFIERQASGNHIIRIEPPISWHENESMVDRINKYVRRIEAAIRRRPDLWVWFHDRYAFSHLGRG